MLATACSIQSIVANDVILTSTIYLLAVVIAFATDINRKQNISTLQTDGYTTHF
jgi:hypothetical protein